MDDTPGAIAHLLRRTSFGPLPGQVEALVPLGVRGAIEHVLAAPPLPEPPPDRAASEDEGLDNLVNWWIARFGSPEAGLHEKLTWFWHGHFTTSADKADDPRQLHGQHLLLRRHALGSFRALVREITTDPAMLYYLDGNGSTANAPNENYARELMELFTLGVGNYTEADVEAAARALAGWYVNTLGNAHLDAASADRRGGAFLGRRRVRGVDGVIDAVCDSPACAPFVVGRLYRFLVGTEPDDARRAELAAVFAGADLEIRPLVEAILRGPDFLAARYTRPRYPVEWVTAAGAAFGQRPESWLYWELGQVPFWPPNVAGWPHGPRWVAAGLALVKAGLALHLADESDLDEGLRDVDAVLRRCALYEVSATTRSALEQAARRVADPADRAYLLTALAVTSPEFALA